MKRIFFILILIINALNMNAQNKNNAYQQQWKQVAVFEEKSLPKSANEIVDKILKQAIADKNSAQAIKAVIYKGKYDIVTDNQNDTSIFRNLSAMLDKSKDEVEKSVLHSMLGELYLNYYDKYHWQTRNRTNVEGFVPKDMKEWTQNMFYDKIVEHLNASLSAQSKLENTLVPTYSAVVDLGNDSRIYYPTMFDFLALRAIDFFENIRTDDGLNTILYRKGITTQSLFDSPENFVQLNFNPAKNEYDLWRLETYRKLMSSLLSRNLNKSVLLLDLQKIDYLKHFDVTNKEYAKASLESLLKKWENNEMSVEIIDKLTDIDNSDTEDSVAQEKALKERYDLLSMSIRKYPQYKRISILKNKLNNLTIPTINISGDKSYGLKSPKKFKIGYRNFKSASFKLYQVQQQVLNATKKTSKTLIKEIPFSFASQPPYLTKDTTIEIDISKYGSYLLETSSPLISVDNNYVAFTVSDLAAFARESNNNEYEFYVVDRKTGAPVTNAEVNIYQLSNNWDNQNIQLVKALPVDNNGNAKWVKPINGSSFRYQVVQGDDKWGVLSDLPYNYYGRSGGTSQRNSTFTSIFTDRSIYRPGQTIYFKAVITQSTDSGMKLLPNKSVTIKLRDSNGQVAATKTLTSNEFGSVSSEFILPKDKLNGMYTLMADNGALSVRVEEYKRPTFDVTFEKVDKTYKFDVPVTLKGTAQNYSGVKLQNATVEYRITRARYWWFGGVPKQFQQGTLKTDDNGDFTITFTPKKEDYNNNYYRYYQNIYTFNVEAKVTDVNGESQIGNYQLSVGDVSMVLDVSIPEKIEKSVSNTLKISAQNLDGKDIETHGTYQIFSLLPNDSVQSEVLNGSFVTGEQKDLLSKIQRLTSGKYRIKLQAKDNQDKLVEAQRDFVLFSYDDKKPPIKTNNWLVEKNTTFAPGKDAEIVLGVSDKNVNVLYELWSKTNLVERKWVKMSEENKTFRIPYQEKYKDGLTLMLTYIKDEEFYSHNVKITTAEDKKELQVKMDVFRDKIRPGSNEEWTVSVKDAKGNSANAEILASMYDISLDKIYPLLNWSLRKTLDRYNVYMTQLSINEVFNQTQQYLSGRINYADIYNLEFDTFNWFGLNLRGEMVELLFSRGAGGTSPIYKGQSVMDATVQTESHSLSENKIITKTDAAPSTPEPEAPKILERYDSDINTESIRRNFNETAFFYPQLRTNEKGETLIAFTVPESNTKWRFRVLAHDKNLNVGTTENFTVSQKELMITPNLPRFFRHGDKTMVSTKISNLLDNALSGKVRLQLFNPLTDEIIRNIAIQNAEQDFSLKQNASTDASWSFEIPSDVDVLGVRIIADSKEFSDGEQHAIAVVPNRMLVTESMRMDVNRNETKTFEMKRISNPSSTAENYRLTLEFTNNPAWYAVQALPVISNPESDNSVAWFAAYYANNLGTYIVKTYPKVSAMINAWKQQSGSKETFLSNLQKSEELKAVLLEETPWVLEAKTEQEQKEKLALLFDLNRSENITKTALEKIKSLQTSSGGWSWFKDFKATRSITHYILYGFNQLTQLKANDRTNDIRAMEAKAISFIDSEALHSFEQLKKYNKNWNTITSISTTELEYVYVRSMYPQYALSQKLQEMTSFYMSVLQKNWTKYSLYERSLIAVLMHKKGQNGIMQDILKSFREHATNSEEMGMYWANNRSTVFMSQSAVSVHTFIMDAFRQGAATSDEMDNMKRWLLKQKQTQIWESTHATTDAVYALLSTGSDWFSGEGKTAIQLGGKTIQPQSQELGTGYHKETWMRDEIKPSMGKVVVKHEGNAPAWGALYLQYFEDLDKIAKTDASLDVEKLLFKVITDASGRKLIPVNESNRLKVGDKVTVRLTIRTDRDMEFVHLKDMRAACFEPVQQISENKWRERTIYYQTNKDASMNFYFDFLPKGTYVFEYDLFVSRKGNYSNGITTIQSMYAPEFTSHTQGIRINVE